MFASDLDPATKQQLARGARLTELLKQNQFSPMSAEKQTVSIWAGSEGHLDDIPVEDVLRFEAEFHEHLERKTNLLDTIRDLTAKLSDEIISELDQAITDFKAGFQPSSDAGIHAGSEEFDSAQADEVQQEKIVKQSRGSSAKKA